MGGGAPGWALGEADGGRAYAQAEDGTLVVDGVTVSDPQGWIRLSLRPQSYPWQIRLRVRLGADARGRPALYACEVAVAGREYASLGELVSAESGDWLALLADAVRTEIARRVAHAWRATHAGGEDAGDAADGERARTGVRATVKPRETKADSGRGEDEARAPVLNPSGAAGARGRGRGNGRP